MNPELLSYAGSGAKIYDSAKMTLEEVLAVIREAEEKGLTTVRLHTGEPSLYGAVREQMDVLAAEGISYESCPGVSACFGAAADLNLEYTLPGISQSLIITRMAGAGAGEHREFCRTSGVHGSLLKCGNGKRTVEKTDRRRVCAGYAGSDRLQGDLAGRGGVRVHGGDACCGGGGASDYEDGADSGGRCAGSAGG